MSNTALQQLLAIDRELTRKVEDAALVRRSIVAALAPIQKSDLATMLDRNAKSIAEIDTDEVLRHTTALLTIVSETRGLVDQKRQLQAIHG